MPRVTLAAVNAAIKAAGGGEQLFKGDDYFYFGEGTAESWRNGTMVMIPRLNDWTIEQWLDEWKTRFNEHKEGK